LPAYSETAWPSSGCLPRTFSARGALKVLGKHPDDGQPVALYSGRYGAYVKHGKVNATLPDQNAINNITLEEALELIAAKAGKKGGKGKASGARAPSAAKPRRKAA